MNVDFNRFSPHTCILTDFIKDFNLYSCGDTDMISVLYNDVISACIAASDHIPTSTRGGQKG